MNEKTKNLTAVVLSALIIFAGLILCIFLPRKSYSTSERRELEKFPTLTKQSVIDGTFTSDFEKYASDNFPLRDAFRSLKAYTSYYVFMQKDNNGIYVDDGHIAAIDYPFDESSVDYAASRFEYIYSNFLNSTNRVFFSVIPDKSGLLYKKAGVLGYDSTLIASRLEKKLPFASYIDIIHTLNADDYYKTDSHWKQQSIIDTANVLTRALGVTIPQSYQKHNSSTPFYGVYYGQAAIGSKADSISYLTNSLISSFKVFDHQNNKEIPVYDTARLDGRDPYETFLSGALSLITIENPSAQTKKQLVMFRDSFGSSIAPLIAQGYSKVTLVDIRYISPSYVCTLIDFTNADVLFMYSSSVLNSSDTIK